MLPIATGRVGLSRCPRGATLALAALLIGPLAGCDTVPDPDEFHALPKDPHPWLPVPREGAQIATGGIEADALEQPIPFTHHRHVTVLGMDCQYCHADARRSIHGGVPAVEVCMGCHQYVFTDSPQIQKIHTYWQEKEPIPWQKVHDLPDYVHFDHHRHVRGGVQCVECHGQVPLMGEWPEGDAERADVMWREASLQMGWCLDCHGTHPSIDENYGDQADLRRAELKDCWTCHK